MPSLPPHPPPLTTPQPQPTPQPARQIEHWKGFVELPGGQLEFAVTMEPADDASWTGTIDLPMQNVVSAQLLDVSVEGRDVRFVFEPQGTTVSAVFTDDRVVRRAGQVSSCRGRA